MFVNLLAEFQNTWSKTTQFLKKVADKLDKKINLKNTEEY